MRNVRAKAIGPVPGVGRVLVVGALALALTGCLFTERVDVAADGTAGNRASTAPDLSADGRLVLFTSEATNLVPGDTNGRSDVFVRDNANAGGAPGLVGVRRDAARHGRRRGRVDQPRRALRLLHHRRAGDPRRPRLQCRRVRPGPRRGDDDPRQHRPGLEPRPAPLVRSPQPQRPLRDRRRARRPVDVVDRRPRPRRRDVEARLHRGSS